MSPRTPPSFEERALSTTRNLVAYGRYGGDEAKAAKVLHSHVPERTLAACAEAVRAYSEAWKDGIEMVAANVAAYDALRKDVRKVPEALVALEAAFAETHTAMPPALVSAMLFTIHDWYHMR